MLCRSTASCFIFVCFILSSSAFANESYQFSVSVAASDLDYESQGNGEVYVIKAKAYLDPILLDGRQPYSVSSSYQRVSALSIFSVKGDTSNLNYISGGRILTGFDSRSDHIGVRFARKDMPLWLGLNYSRLHSNESRYRGGSVSVSPEDHIRKFILGWYAGEGLNVYTSFEDSDDETYGIGVRSLVKFSSEQFLEALAEYEYIKSDADTIQIINATIRNIDSNPEKYTQLHLGIKYFPTVATSIGLAFSHLNWGHDIVQDVFSTSANYFFESGFSLFASYSQLHNDSQAWQMSMLEYNTLSMGMSYRF